MSSKNIQELEALGFPTTKEMEAIAEKCLKTKYSTVMFAGDMISGDYSPLVVCADDSTRVSLTYAILSEAADRNAQDYVEAAVKEGVEDNEELRQNAALLCRVKLFAALENLIDSQCPGFSELYQGQGEVLTEDGGYTDHDLQKALTEAQNKAIAAVGVGASLISQRYGLDWEEAMEISTEQVLRVLTEELTGYSEEDDGESEPTMDLS